MAVNTTENVKSYSCDGVQDDFSFLFSIIGTDTSVLKIILWEDETSAKDELSEDSGDYSYTVSVPNNNYENGGTISTTKLDGAVYVAYAWPAGYTITIERIVPYTQPSEFSAGGLDPKALEQTFDNLEHQIQQLDNRKSIHGPPSDPTTSIYELPTVSARKGRVLGFDDDTGNIIAVSSLPTSGVSVTPFMESVLDDANAATAQATLKLKDYTATLGLADIVTKAPWIDVRAYASFSAAISDIGSDDKTLLISDSQTVSTNETVPSNVTLLFLQGGKLNIDVDKVVTIQGTIQAGNYQIFTGSGYVDTNQLPGHNNICWYPGSSLNDKWDAMVNQWTRNWLGRTVYVPRVPLGNPAAINSFSTKYAWKLDGSLNIDGKCNNTILIFDGQLFVESGSGVTNAVLMSDTDKIENVLFPHGLWIDCNNEADTGLLIEGGARITIAHKLTVVKCVNGLVVNNDTSPVSELSFNKVYVATWSGSAVKFSGTAAEAITDSYIRNITANLTVGTSCKVLEIEGRVLNFIIDSMNATKYTGDSIIDIGIHLKATSEGPPAMYRSNIGSAYFDFINIAIKTEDTSGTASDKILNLDIGPIHAGSCTTFAELGYLQECRLDITDYDDPITVGSDCQDVRLITSKGVATNITDNGVRTRINGVGSESANAETPTAGSWEPGEIVDFIDSGDASGNGVYLKLPDASWVQIGT